MTFLKTWKMRWVSNAKSVLAALFPVAETLPDRAPGNA